MPVLRVVVLWHQHQPFYKDLVTGEYRLPWVRLHALKDYYGMVKLLDEFPNVHQTFNLVPSLITQIQDYVTGAARDPFLEVAAKPARDLTPDERHFALQYLFQANPVNLIGRYPRYRELWDHFRNAGGTPESAEKYFSPQDFTDLQVLSQIAWFDEFFLDDPDIAGLIQKGRGYSLDDQRFVMARERELLAKVLPAHAEAAQHGRIEISTSAFYHPILPLVCDTNMGAVSTPGLPLAPESLSPSRGRSRATTAWTESASGGFRDSSAGSLAVRGQCFGRSPRHRAESGREVDGHRRRGVGPQPGRFFRARRPWPSARRAGREALHHPSLRE